VGRGCESERQLRATGVGCSNAQVPCSWVGDGRFSFLVVSNGVCAVSAVYLVDALTESAA